MGHLGRWIGAMTRAVVAGWGGHEKVRGGEENGPQAGVAQPAPIADSEGGMQYVYGRATGG